MSQEQLQFLSGPQTPLMRQYSEIKSQCLESRGKDDVGLCIKKGKIDSVIGTRDAYRFRIA